MEENYYTLPGEFTLESGQKLQNLNIAYTIQGNPHSQPIIWVCHALTGNQFVNEWWAGIFGPEKLFNENDYCIICANVLGSAYGTTGPLSVQENGEKYYRNFPIISTKDMVKVHERLAKKLKVKKLDILIGASIGGQQAIQWAANNSIQIEQLVLIATNAVHSPFGKAFNEAQRMAILADQTYGLKLDNAGQEGLKAARAIAMISYRSYHDFEVKQPDLKHNGISDYRAASYVNYQGNKLAERFNAYSYFRLTQAMDNHDISRGTNKTIEEVLAAIRVNKTIVIGIDSDILFPPQEQKRIAEYIPRATYLELKSQHGHDAFLIEFDWLYKNLKNFLLPPMKLKTAGAHLSTINTSLKRKKIS